ncbi:hypothetical protein P4O66_005652, partial [Electrophorus voltai]
MFESEDSDIEEGPDVIRHKTKIIYQNTFPYIHMEPPDALYERWIKIKPEVKKAVGHMLHISVFWWHILFRQQENHTTTAWAVDTGFLDSNVSNDLSLKRLHRIEILELILNTMEKCLADRDPERRAKDLVSISTSFKMQEDCLAHAVSYLEESGPPGLSRKLLDLGRKELRYQILRFIFTEYARYVQVMSCSKTNMIRELTVDPELWCLQKSEEMKNKGNEQFQKKKYDLAVKWYTKAIKHHTSNHFLYGNRALAFIRCEKYLKAMGDGKRAIILQQDWAKGHYRFCDALFFLGAKEKAVEANLAAQSICSADPEGMRDLQQQYHRFMAEVFECKRKCSADTFAGQLNWIHKRTSEMAARRTKKAALCVPEKQSVKNKHPPAQEKPRSGSTGSADGCSSSGPSSKEQFRAAVLDAHTALYDQRCRNAQQAFSLALSILDSTGTKTLGISELDRALLIYGYATAMIEIGQPEELGEAQRQFEKLSFSEDRKFQSLVLYGMGKVFLKENRFSKALEKFSNALLMVQRQITCGKLTWPTTKVTVEETRPEYLKQLLESSVEMCKFPPKPDAICRHQYCLGHTVQIYFTDPDFKGFIRMSCCQRCKVEFHISCWKKFKTSEFSDKNDKDFLQDSCFTPDCMGRICHIVIFGSTGLIKCEFEAHILKSKAPGKLRVRQPYTSLKKSKEDGLKLRRKQQRAPATLNEDETITIEEEANNKEAAKESPKDYTVHGDRVLHQIYESRELFKDELHSISSMLVCLRPWMELDEGKSHASVLKGRSEPQALWELVDVLLERRNRVWARVFIQILSGCQNIKPKLHDWAQQLDSVGLKAAESFIGHCGDQLEELDLSSLLAFPPLQDVLIEKFGTMPELFDNTGFTIIEYLKQAPPQEMRLFIWTLEENRERYPTCFTILDEYFEMDAICLVIKKTGIDNVSSLNKAKSKNRKKKQKEPKSVIFMSGMRSDFVRDEEDEDIFAEEDSFMLLDGNDPFSVPDHLRDQVAEFEGQYVSSGHLNYYKKFLDNNPDPTKESLYEYVRENSTHYTIVVHTHHHKDFAAVNLSYFEQILEEHGPLETSDPLLVGELENFPAEAQQKISAAGGLEPFLCKSLRFYMMDNLIGLMGHAVSLQHPIADDTPMLFNSFSDTYDDLEPRVPSHLNPTAKEFLPQFEHLNVSDSNMSYDNDILDDEDIPVLAHSDPQNSPPGPSALSNHCVFGSHITTNIDYVHVSQDMDMAETAQTELQEVEYSEQLLISSPKDFIFNSTSLSPDNNINPYSEREARELYSSVICKQANAAPESVAVSVQTLEGPKESREDAAVNTEPYLLFEKNKGDMTQKEKNNVKFEKQIQKMLQTYEYLQTRREEEVSVLEAEVEDYHQKVEVENPGTDCVLMITNKELSLFQQKLEEEIRKDQQEKRDNQEALKALKVENKELLDLQERLSKQIQDKNMEYQAELDCFLEIRQVPLHPGVYCHLVTKSNINQCEAEKMSLEEEIKRCRDRCAKAANRSQSAQLCILQNRRECGLRGLRKCLSDGKAILLNMTELSSRSILVSKTILGRVMYTEDQILNYNDESENGMSMTEYPSSGLHSTIEAWKACVQEAEKKIARTEAQYEEQMELVSTGNRLESLPLISVPSAPAPPPVPALLPLPANQHLVPQQLSVRHVLPDLAYAAQQPPAWPQSHSAVTAPQAQPAERTHSPPVPINQMPLQPLDVFEKIVNRLSSMFPHYSRAVLAKFIQEVRSASVSRFNMLTYEDMINRVAQLILDHQEDASLNMEDPCIICHEEMAPEDVCVLECRHSFHRE